jgi:hypothetical protein
MSIDLAAVRAAAQQLTRAIDNPNDPAARRHAACLKEDEDKLTTVVDQPGYRPVRPDELCPTTVLQILGERLRGLIDLGAPEARAIPRPVREHLLQVRALLGDSFWPFFAWPPGQPAWADRRRALLLALEAVTEAPAPTGVNAGLELIAGGISYRGHPVDLVGRPRQMLEALLRSRWRRLTAADLCKEMEVDTTYATFPEQVIKDTACTLRAALRAVIKAAGQECGDPIRSVGKGADLTYSLEMP